MRMIQAFAASDHLVLARARTFFQSPDVQLFTATYAAGLVFFTLFFA